MSCSRPTLCTGKLTFVDFTNGALPSGSYLGLTRLEQQRKISRWGDDRDAGSWFVCCPLPSESRSSSHAAPVLGCRIGSSSVPFRSKVLTIPSLAERCRVSWLSSNTPTRLETVLSLTFSVTPFPTERDTQPGKDMLKSAGKRELEHLWDPKEVKVHFLQVWT